MTPLSYNDYSNVTMKTNPYESKDFSSLGEILKEAMKSCRRENDQELMRVWDIWDNALGAVISENARPKAFKGKFLIVHVSSSAWTQQLQYLKKDIIQKINAALGKEMINDIKFKIGEL